MLETTARPATSHPAILNLGFRPFFAGAAVYAVLSMLAWMAIYVFGWQLPDSAPDTVLWHAHEMIYGYSLAVVAGFLLTAVRNWTGRQTLNGYPLLALFLLWVAARVLVFLGQAVPLHWTALVDCSFIVLLTLAVTVPVVKVRQWKQLGIVSKLVLLLASNLLFYAGALELYPDGVRAGLYSGLYLIIALILVMGRRVIPSFIQNGVDYPVVLKNRTWLDILGLLVFLAFWLADIIEPDTLLVALLSTLLAILHAIKLAGWHTSGIWRKPLLWVLYLGYASLIAGFVLKAGVTLFAISPFLALHAFAVGGISMVSIGMMARVTLGHTGRNVLEPPDALSVMFATLFLGAIFRVSGPLLDGSRYVLWIGISQGLWLVAFGMFLYIFLPMLLQPRVDGRQG